MEYTFNGYVVTFVLDTNGNVVTIKFPFSTDGFDNLELTYNYGVSLALAQAVVQSVINTLP